MKVLYCRICNHEIHAKEKDGKIIVSDTLAETRMKAHVLQHKTDYFELIPFKDKDGEINMIRKIEK